MHDVIIGKHQYCREGYPNTDIESKVENKIMFKDKNELQNKEISDVWEKMKRKIFPRVINTEINQSLLEELPHRELLDLSVVYYIRPDSNCVDLINIDQWEIDEHQLYESAITNLCQNTKVVSNTMVSVLQKLRPDEEKLEMLDGLEMNETVMQIITNEEKRYGAHMILQSDFMRSVQDRIGDFYILPMSIHELLVLPVNDNAYHAGELSNIVFTTNRTTVDYKEVLSDHVYKYSNGKIVIAA